MFNSKQQGSGFTRVVMLSCMTAGLVALSGCASQATNEDAASILPQKATKVTTQPTPKSPLLPSAFFADGGKNFTTWQCEQSHKLVSTQPNSQKLRLWTELGNAELKRVQVDSGERYVNGNLSFWQHGKIARVDGNQQSFSCSMSQSRQTLTRQNEPNVIFIARGNEPGWQVRLERQTPTMELVSDYGQAKDRFTYRVVSVDNGAKARVELMSDSGKQAMEMIMQATACTDSMSDEPWPVSITLRYGNHEWHGCGQGVEAK